MKIHLINPSDVSFGIGVITPRWLYVLAEATPRAFGDPVIVDETLELLEALSEMLRTRLAWRHIAARESDQRVFVADLSRVKAATGWSPRVNTREGLRRMLAWVGSRLPEGAHP